MTRAIRDVSLQELRDGLAEGRLTVIDVREDHEFESGAIPGSVSMPLSRFDPAGLSAFEGDRIVFSCAAGVRSRHAIALCEAAGLAHDEHFPAGFKGWVAAGGPVKAD